MLRKTVPFTFLLALLLFGIWSCNTPTVAKSVSEPGGNPNDEYLALNNPDEYAWQLFFYLNRPAVAGKAGVADPSRKFGQLEDDKPVVWETWALASGNGNYNEVFPPASTPVPWDQLDRKDPKRLHLDKNFELLMLRARKNLSATSHKRAGGRPKGMAPFSIVIPHDGEEDNGQEVRMNRCAFESVVDQRMYNCAGLGALLNKAKETRNRFLIQVPERSKEVKAQWIKIDPGQKCSFYWRTDDNGQLWGLVALHIITKDLPNWFWADFGHIDCEKKEKHLCGLNVNVDTELKDSTTRESNGVRKETRFTVWENYRLRGTETAFTNAIGEPNELSNPVIEFRNQHSSCIGCHAQATIGAGSGVCINPTLGRIDTPNDYKPIPDPTLYKSPKKDDIRYLQTDFMWSPVQAMSNQTNSLGSKLSLPLKPKKK